MAKWSARRADNQKLAADVVTVGVSEWARKNRKGAQHKRPGKTARQERKRRALERLQHTPVTNRNEAA